MSPPPRVLIAHYSRSGHTARLADTLAAALTERGFDVARETIKTKRDWSYWLLPIPLLPLLPLLSLYLLSARFRALWHRVYYQPAQAIQPLGHADLAPFDLVLLGTPKWLYFSYPVARWIATVRGLEGKFVAPFATFCGPPLQVFELDMLFLPLADTLRRRGATPGPTLAVSSAYHRYFFFGEMEALFRALSRRVFGRPLDDFTLDGALGRAAVNDFCDDLARRFVDRETAR